MTLSDDTLNTLDNVGPLIASAMAGELGFNPPFEWIVDMGEFYLKAVAFATLGGLTDASLARAHSIAMAMVAGTTKIVVYGGGTMGAIQYIKLHPLFLKIPWQLQIVPYPTHIITWV